MPKVKERLISSTVVNAEILYGQLTFVVSFILFAKIQSAYFVQICYENVRPTA